MTKEECIGLLKRYAEYNGLGIPDLAGCREAMSTAAELLQRPTLPSNLDEAAEKNFETMEVLEHENIFEETHNKIFKAGVEWMAGQGVSWEDKMTYYDGFLIYGQDERAYTMGGDFNDGDEVVVQIRKK